MDPRPARCRPTALQRVCRGEGRRPRVDARTRVRRQARADARSLSVRIAIAQCAPALGAVKRNLDMHEKWIARAKAAGARLVIFPELSLTGYYLKDLAADVACAADDPQLARIAD